MVILRASHIVKPAEPTPDEVMYLSECDQIKPLTHAPTIYFYRPTTHPLLQEAVRILKYSLGKALVTFYPLAGRLHWAGGGGRIELHCNSTGALLIEAESDLRIDDFGDFRPSPEVKSLIPSADFASTPIQEVPLLLVQVTKHRCGGISLGAGISHVVIDGQGASLFFNEWARIARGEKSDDPPPFLDRKILKPSERKSPALPDLEYSDFFPLPPLLGQSDSLEERKKETTAIMLKLSKERIEALRKKAVPDLQSTERTDQAVNNNFSNSNGNPFSRFVVICSHIWKCVSMARGLKPEQETVLFVSVDFRNRLNPPLPERYFGNAVIPLPIKTTVGELLSKPPRFVARKISDAIKNVGDQFVRSYLACIKNIRDISGRRHFHTVGCSQGSFYGNPNLIITSWAGLPLFGQQFGWGNEVYLGPGSLGYDGKVFLIPSQNGDGSFLIPMRLQLEHVGDFEKYFNEEI